MKLSVRAKAVPSSSGSLGAGRTGLVRVVSTAGSPRLGRNRGILPGDGSQRASPGQEGGSAAGSEAWVAQRQLSQGCCPQSPFYGCA